jgi:carbamoylphosphate synthase large subunit
VSQFLVKTIIEQAYSVVNLIPPKKFPNLEKLKQMPTNKAIEYYNSSDKSLIYTNSENALEWIMAKIPDKNLKKQIQIYKDKYLFRQTMKSYFPDYFFKKIALDKLDLLNIEEIPKPFVIKPKIGFFSVAVYIINSIKEWPKIKAQIKSDIVKNKGIFPENVLNSSEFIIEEAYEGEEYAVDAYIDQEGKPVILNIYHHYHLNDSDTSDRFYYTSQKIINKYHSKIITVLEKISRATHVKSFPMHLELRLDLNNEFGIIEANPMRFAGFCVGDLAWFAY